MIGVADERNYNFPYLKDEDQSVAKRYGALVTLHAFVLDNQRRLGIEDEWMIPVIPPR